VFKNVVFYLQRFCVSVTLVDTSVDNEQRCYDVYNSQNIVDAMLQMQFMILFSRQGKLRLQKWYVAHTDKVKKKIVRELVSTVLARKPKMSSFIEWKDMKIVYKRLRTSLLSSFFFP